MKKPAIYWLIECALLLACALLPMVLSLWPQDGMAFLAVLAAHVLYPALSLFLPWWAARRGAAPFVCAAVPFPLYVAAWTVFGLPLPAVPTLLTLLLSVLGANIGAEKRKRCGKNKA